MNNLNSILIEGNMVRDPLLKTTPKGNIVCNFTIASNRYHRQESNVEREVSFFDIEVWGKLASACADHGRKGRGVRVVGRLKQDRWVGSDGKTHTRVAIVAEHIEYRPDFKNPGDFAAGAEARFSDSAATYAHMAAGSRAGILAEAAAPACSDMYEEEEEEIKIEELQAFAF